MNIQYQIQLHDYWHVSSGLSGGVIADSEVIKTMDGLPYIPGKTLKGLIKDAANTLTDTNTNLISQSFLEDVFGVKEELGTPCHFSNAYLSENLQHHILAANQKDYLFQLISSTAIDSNGQAKDKSLRTIQVTIPLVLYAEIYAFPEEAQYIDYLGYCLKFIKRLGLKRNRGLGRCDWSILKK